jgi:dTDP-4-dehydrorhamnose reductase
MIRPATPPSLVPLPLLITGIAGVPGFNALHYFSARYPGRVIGIRQAENVKLAGPNIVACNAEDREGMARLFEKHRFQAVLDCAGNCALKACELDPELAWRINVEGVRNLLSQVTPRGIRLVHLSCDLVFSGLRDGGYTEEDTVDPVTVYGKTMAAAEEILLHEYPPACILRISLPMGVSANGHAGAIDWISSRFKKSRPATLYFDEIRTPTYTDCMNLLYEELLAGGLRGLYHAGGPRRLSLFEIAQIINRVGGYDPDLLQGIPRREAGPIPPRAGNVSMNSEKLCSALGYNPFDAWPYCGTLVPNHRHWHRERPASSNYSPRTVLQLLCTNPNRFRSPDSPSAVGI